MHSHDEIISPTFTVPHKLCLPVDRARLYNAAAHDAVARWVSATGEFARVDGDSDNEGIGYRKTNGLVLIGQAGSGKTRAALSPLVVSDGTLDKETLFCRTVDLINKFRELTRKHDDDEWEDHNANVLDGLIADLRHVETLILDDLDKVFHVRPREVSLLYDIFDERLHDGDELLTIITMNVRGTALVKKLSGWENSLEEEAKAIADRLNPERGLCVMIDFDAEYHAPELS